MARRKSTPLGDRWYAFQRKQPTWRGGRTGKHKLQVRRTHHQGHFTVPLSHVRTLVPSPLPHRLTLNQYALPPHNPTHHTQNSSHHLHLLPPPTNNRINHNRTFTMYPSRQRPPAQTPHIPRVQGPTNHPALPDLSYQQILTALPVENQQEQFRYCQPIWQYFINHDPGLALNLSPGPCTVPQPLPLPPDPMHPAWRGRCYNCLTFVHDQNDCRDLERTCAICWQKGHQAKNCLGLPEPDRLDPLQPRGVIGELGLPGNRPAMLNVYVPETAAIRADIEGLQQAIIIDGRLKPNHTANKLQAILMSVCTVEVPFRITQLTEHQYMLLLPQGECRTRFLHNYTTPLQSFGYVPYQWEPVVNGTPLKLRFKVWVQMEMASPLGWNIKALLPVASTFGVLLDHTPLTNASSIHLLTAVIGVPNLQEVPHAVRMWIRGIAWPVKIRVIGWIEEPLDTPDYATPEPPPQHFQQLLEENSQTMASHHQDGKKYVPVDCDMLFEMWKNMEPGEQKARLELTLRTSGFFDIKEKKDLLESIKDGEERATLEAAAARIKGKCILLEGPGSKQTGGSGGKTIQSQIAPIVVSIPKAPRMPESTVVASVVRLNTQKDAASVSTQPGAKVQSVGVLAPKQTRKEFKEVVKARATKAAPKAQSAKGQLTQSPTQLTQNQAQLTQNQAQLTQDQARVTHPRQLPGRAHLLSAFDPKTRPWLENPLPQIEGLPTRPSPVEVDLLHDPVEEAAIQRLIERQEADIRDMEVEGMLQKERSDLGRGTEVEDDQDGDDGIGEELNGDAEEEIQPGEDGMPLDQRIEGADVDRDEDGTDIADLEAATPMQINEEGDMVDEEDNMEMVDGLNDQDQEYEEYTSELEDENEIYENIGDALEGSDVVPETQGGDK